MLLRRRWWWGGTMNWWGRTTATVPTSNVKRFSTCLQGPVEPTQPWCSLTMIDVLWVVIEHFPIISIFSFIWHILKGFFLDLALVTGSVLNQSNYLLPKVVLPHSKLPEHDDLVEKTLPKDQHRLVIEAHLVLVCVLKRRRLDVQRTKQHLWCLIDREAPDKGCRCTEG